MTSPTSPLMPRDVYLVCETNYLWVADPIVGDTIGLIKLVKIDPDTILGS